MTNPNRTKVGDRVTIYPRGKKKIYVADYWLDGRHCRKSLDTTNKKAALQAAAPLAADLAAGRRPQAPAAVSVARAVADYLAYLAADGKAANSVKKFRGVFAKWVPYLAAQRVTRLDQYGVRHYDGYRAARTAVADAMTVYNDSVIVKLFYKWSKSRGLVSENPLADVRLKKPLKEPKGGPALADVDRILAALPAAARAPVAVLAFTGMRAGDLRNLTPADADLAGGWLRIVSRPGYETKTRRSRNVPIHLRLKAVLAERPTARGRWLFTAPPSPKYPRGGNRLNIKALNQAFKAAARQAGLPVGRKAGYTLHSLRAFFETHTVNAHTPQRVVDAWLGHAADQSMGAKYYRLTEADSQRFMQMVPFGDGAATHGLNKEVG